MEHQRRDEASIESLREMDAAPIRFVDSHFVADQTLLLSDALVLGAASDLPVHIDLADFYSRTVIQQRLRRYRKRNINGARSVLLNKDAKVGS